MPGTLANVAQPDLRIRRQFPLQGQVPLRGGRVFQEGIVGLLKRAAAQWDRPGRGGLRKLKQRTAIRKGIVVDDRRRKRDPSIVEGRGTKRSGGKYAKAGAYYSLVVAERAIGDTDARVIVMPIPVPQALRKAGLTGSFHTRTR